MGIFIGYLIIAALGYIAFLFYGEWKVAKGELEKEQKRRESETWSSYEKRRNKEW